jgi:hypothetical protein
MDPFSGREGWACPTFFAGHRGYCYARREKRGPKARPISAQANEAVKKSPHPARAGW